MQTTFFHSNTTQIYYINLNYPRMYTTCFGLYLGHLQACQHKNIYRKIHYNRWPNYCLPYQPVDTSHQGV